MNKFIKVALVGAVLATLTACTGHIELLLRLPAAPSYFYF